LVPKPGEYGTMICLFAAKECLNLETERRSSISYLMCVAINSESFNMQLLLEILRQPVADEDLIGYGLHGCHFLDRLDL
jgi:hypothetical protein